MFTKIKAKFSTLFNRLKTRVSRLKAWAARHKLLTFVTVALGLAVVIVGAHLLKRTPVGEKFITAVQSQLRRITGWFKRRSNVVIVATAATAATVGEEVIPAKPVLNSK